MATIKESRDRAGQKCWRVRIRIEGFETLSKTLYAPEFTRRKDVEIWAQLQEAQLRERRKTIADGIVCDKTVADAIAVYKKVKTFKSKSHKEFIHLSLDWWEMQIGHMKLHEVSTPIVSEGRDILSGKGYSASSVKKSLQAISGVYVMSNEKGWVRGNPVEGVRKPIEPRSRVRYLTDDELNRLLSSVRSCQSLAMPVIVTLALTTGARKTELLSLKWSEVDFSRKRLIFLETKNNHRRSLSLADPAIKTLKCWHESHKQTTYVFENDLGKPLTINKTWQRIVKRAKLEDFHFHDLRHCAASYLAMNGVPTVQIADILGHKTLAMVGKYAHLSEDSNRQALEAMANKFLAPVFDPKPLPKVAALRRVK